MQLKFDLSVPDNLVDRRRNIDNLIKGMKFDFENGYASDLMLIHAVAAIEVMPGYIILNDKDTAALERDVRRFYRKHIKECTYGDIVIS